MQLLTNLGLEVSSSDIPEIFHLNIPPNRLCTRLHLAHYLGNLTCMDYINGFPSPLGPVWFGQKETESERKLGTEYLFSRFPCCYFPLGNLCLLKEGHFSTLHISSMRHSLLLGPDNIFFPLSI